MSYPKDMRFPSACRHHEDFDANCRDCIGKRWREYELSKRNTHTRALPCPFCHAYRFDRLPGEVCLQCGATLQGDFKTVEHVEGVRLMLGGDGLRTCCKRALRDQRMLRR